MDEGHDSSEDEDYLLSEIIEGKLYLSCAFVASKTELIKKYKIKGIISLGGFEEHITYKIHSDLDVDHFFVFIDDHESEPIHLEFRGCIDFIKTEGAVLVHCMAGISRSASIVIAYLMLERKMSFLDAYAYVKKRRSIVRPNSGFLRQLRELDLEIKK